MTNEHSLRMLVFSSLMAALIAVGAFIAIPIGPVPIVLQNLFVLLAGLLLGGRWAVASVSVYLLAGACGLPVFSGGSGGIGHLVGPLGGYLLAYLPAAYLVGFVAERSKTMVFNVVAMIAASLLVYAIGVSWLKVVLGLTYAKALAVGMYPFVIGDALKIAAAVPIAHSLKPLMAEKQQGAALGDQAGVR